MQTNPYHYVTVDFSNGVENENYKPYYLDAFRRVGADLLILQITPYYTIDGDRFRHEIHIRNDNFEDDMHIFKEFGLPRIVKGLEPIMLYRDSYNKDVLEVYEGDYLQEAWVHTYIPYSSIEEKLIEIE